jgi:hypothetical protein
VRRPQFIIIGAMKSATSSLHAQLALQPGIFMSEPKEPNFFSDDVEYRRGADWYLSLFSGALEGDLTGESSTHYTKLPDYPETVSRMKKLLPELKLVYVMRHPIDRLISHYVHQWTQNVIRCDINEAVRCHCELIDVSRYSYQLTPYFDVYGSSSVLPVFYSALKRDPQRQLERIATHIGYAAKAAWYEDLAAQNVSSDRIHRFPGYRLVVDSPPMAFLRRKLVPRSLRDRVKERLSMKERPALQSSQVARLEEIFDADLRVLSRWLDTDLDCRNFDEKTACGELEWTD